MPYRHFEAAGNDGTMYPGTNYFVRYIKNRLDHNKNFLVPIVGQTGSGKSYAALDLMMKIAGDRFTMNNVCFRAKDFIARLNSGELQPGDVLLWDESGVDLNSKQWMSITNRIVNFILQTFRHKNLVVIFTLPFFSFLDSDTRKLVHAQLQTQKIDFDTKTTTIKPFLIQVNQETGKMYRKFLRVKNAEGVVVPVKKIKTALPPKEVLIIYEERKNDFTTRLNKEIEQMLIKLEEKEKRKFEKPRELTEKQRQVYDLYLEQGTIDKVAKILNISNAAVSGHLIYAKKKLNIDEIPKKIEVLTSPKLPMQLSNLIGS